LHAEGRFGCPCPWSKHQQHYQEEYKNYQMHLTLEQTPTLKHYRGEYKKGAAL
jgi:hypothetical protein